ncbi:MAG: UbiD family decarboxylase [Nitrospinota bacterium]
MSQAVKSKTYFQDLREYISTLEENDLLYRISEPVNKDTELMPLVRWQFRGLPESQRKAFLFEKVTDSRGRQYQTPVAVAVTAISRKMYALGMGCEETETADRWVEARNKPIPPEVIPNGPVHEEVHLTADFEREHGGLDEFPIPISTPGFDPAPFLTAACWVSKDPETGIRNLGTYRAQIKAPDKTGLLAYAQTDLIILIRRARRAGVKALPIAGVLGCAPNVCMASAAKLPLEVDELAVAGGLSREPLPLVKCKTVDLEVPATAEIVIEGEIPIDYLEPEAPFGEYTGYLGLRGMAFVVRVKAITHRKDPITQVFISQMPPSESSKLRQIAYESNYYKFLRYDCHNVGVKQVSFHEMGGSHEVIAIRVAKEDPAQAWQALYAAASFSPTYGKIIIAVDEDIDPTDAESIFWAMSFALNPERDIRFVTGKGSNLDPASAPPGATAEEKYFPGPTGLSAVLIDATRKHAYPPVSLPKKEYMERAKEIWERCGLPPLTPRVPWFGYPLGDWPEDSEEDARRAVDGRYYETGKRLGEEGIQAEI